MAIPSVRPRAPPPQHGHGKVGESARDCSLRAGQVRGSLEASTRPLWHAFVHEVTMINLLVLVRSAGAHSRREVAVCGPLSSRSWASEYCAGWFGSESDWLQLISHCGGLCVARTPRLISTSHSGVLHALVEVAVCVALEPHGLGEGGSNARVMAVGCTVVGPVAVGGSRAGPTVILWSRHFLSVFRLSGAATRQEDDD